MRAYVSIRGSRSPRRVDRDASPGRNHPCAALVVAGPRGHTDRFELDYTVGDDGEVYVHFTRQIEGDRRRTVTSLVAEVS